MIIERKETDYGTELSIYAEDRYDPWSVYRVICRDFDYIVMTDQREPPTATVSLLAATNGVEVETVERLAREYLFVAGAAAALQVEKRAKYAEMFPEVTQ